MYVWLNGLFYCLRDFKIKNLEKTLRFELFPDKDSGFALLLYYIDFWRVVSMNGRRKGEGVYSFRLETVWTIYYAD